MRKNGQDIQPICLVQSTNPPHKTIKKNTRPPYFISTENVQKDNSWWNFTGNIRVNLVSYLVIVSLRVKKSKNFFGFPASSFSLSQVYGKALAKLKLSQQFSFHPFPVKVFPFRPFCGFESNRGFKAKIAVLYLTGRVFHFVKNNQRSRLESVGKKEEGRRGKQSKKFRRN